MRNTGRLAALLALAFAATPADALGDVTGTWEGTLACTHSTAAGIDHTKTDVAIGLHDDLVGGLFAHFNGGVPIRLSLVANPDSPSKGSLTGVSCDMAPDNGGYTFHLSVTAKEGSEKGKMKGVFLSTSHPDNPGGAICKLRAKRVSTAIPSPTPSICPP